LAAPHGTRGPSSALTSVASDSRTNAASRASSLLQAHPVVEARLVSRLWRSGPIDPANGRHPAQAPRTSCNRNAGGGARCRAERRAWMCAAGSPTGRGQGSIRRCDPRESTAVSTGAEATGPRHQSGSPRSHCGFERVALPRSRRGRYRGGLDRCGVGRCPQRRTGSRRAQARPRRLRLRAERQLVHNSPSRRARRPQCPEKAGVQVEHIMRRNRATASSWARSWGGPSVSNMCRIRARGTANSAPGGRGWG